MELSDTVFFVSQRVLPIKLAIQIMLEIKSICSTVVNLANFTVGIFIGPIYLPQYYCLARPRNN